MLSKHTHQVQKRALRIYSTGRAQQLEAKGKITATGPREPSKQLTTSTPDIRNNFTEAVNECSKELLKDKGSKLGEPKLCFILKLHVKCTNKSTILID